MLVLIPFDMVRFDSGAQDEEGKTKKAVMERILDVVKKYLALPNRNQDAAAFLTSRFLTRPDLMKKYLPEFLDWAMNNICKKDNPDMLKMGALKAVAAIYKQGKRDDLLQYSPNLLRHLSEQKFNPENPNLLIRKLALKVVQRLGLVFLKSKVASWRYQRGSRSLALNLVEESSGGNGAADKKDNLKVGWVFFSNLAGSTFRCFAVSNRCVHRQDDEDADYDIPDEIEDVIEELLCGLRDRDTVVRWSAAKGVGRVTGRLPKELADDVVGSLLELFSFRETDGAWHGGCLALAELGRRGLLLPQR